ncbi:hypothetical protein EZJ19_06545 [Parasulfuritortus cantonensis]|uniref:Transcription factor zinc-finger domain-containing protein n=1 Tax=Parasulfuritortus cantonensis TaxID=2528202 RepID=A0A4V2NW11_9PROT|nr:zf-TFIIB domain-containing protein [Parasulfuritortus cantonensis]TCJ15562.1 hypothetical protein EZJ19_06545 [Parasulfuritortus cantonensis]
MKCPVCQDTDLLMTERMGVEIDYCPRCRGIWLDRGELDKLLDKAEQGVRAGGPATPAAEWRDHDHHDGHDDHHHKGQHGYGDGMRHSRRRSWLGNLLDFD